LLMIFSISGCCGATPVSKRLARSTSRSLE